MPLVEHFSPQHFHLQLLLVVVPFSSIALVAGFRRHRRPSVLAAGIIGMLLLLIGATWAHAHLGLVADRIFTISGSLVLAAAHYANSRFARRHRKLVGQIS